MTRSVTSPLLKIDKKASVWYNKGLFMYKYIFTICLSLGCMSVSFADQLPSYKQVQVDNFNQQIAQLKTQQEQMRQQMNSLEAQNTDPNVSFKIQQLQAQITQIDKQIANLQKQKEGVQQGL